MAVLDADKEGFLRSERSLIQTIGRAARNENGMVILYADTVTRSMEGAISETNRRRAIQDAYNKQHGIIPHTVKKDVRDIIKGCRTRFRRQNPRPEEDDSRATRGAYCRADSRNESGCQSAGIRKSGIPA